MNWSSQPYQLNASSFKKFYETREDREVNTKKHKNMCGIRVFLFLCIIQVFGVCNQSYLKREVLPPCLCFMSTFC